MDGVRRRGDDNHRDGGATLVEYALLIALIAVACLATLFYFGANRDNSLSRSGSAIFQTVTLIF